MERSCTLCLRRPRDAGGNGSCGLYSPRNQVVGVHNNGNPKMKRDSFEVAWPQHLLTWPHGCSSFRIGDRRPPTPPKQGESLF